MKVLLGHSDDAHVGTDEQHAVVGKVARETKDRGLEVLFMSSEIHEHDDLGGLFADLAPSRRTNR